MGVAVSVSTSTSARSALSFSLSRTPKRCSSSITTRPRFLKRTLPCSRRCVAMTMSTEPSAMPAMTAAASLAGAETRQALDAHRPIGEAVDEGRVMLLGEQRRRDEHRHLLAGLHGDEGGAQRDLCLAEAHVAADHPVHGLARLHVGEHLVDGCGLIGGFLETKSRLEAAIVRLRPPPWRCLRARHGANTGPAARRPRRECVARPCGAPSAIPRRRACAAAPSRPARRCSAIRDAAPARARRACRRPRTRAPETRPCSPRHPWSAGRRSGRRRTPRVPPERRRAGRKAP